VEFSDARALTSLARSLRPDVVMAWNMWGLSNSLLAGRLAKKTPVVYAVSDFWLRDLMTEPRNAWLRLWRKDNDSALRRALRSLVKRMASRFVPTEMASVDWRRVFFTSEKLRQFYADAGFPVSESRVIYWGVTVENYWSDREPSSIDMPVRVLYAGQIEEEKGVHTLLEAVPLLGLANSASVRVSIAGDILNQEYYDRLRKLVAGLNGHCSVQFLGKVSPQEMPEVFRCHDVLVFPSVWQEPFSIVVLEAMASGLCVVGTTTGGSAEILKDGVNSLTFIAGDARDLVRQLQRVVDDAVLRQRLAKEGQKMVRAKFSLSGMVEQIEKLLEAVTC
jgi:glycosyltransferase involved in cell wall biosynthesis